MTRVEVDIEPGEQRAADEVFEEPAPNGGGKRPRAATEVEIEREVTKRQLITSISSIVVVILYMVFTLLRDRDSGVVVIDEDAADDWDDDEEG